MHSWLTQPYSEGMQFIRADAAIGTDNLKGRLREALASGRKVLWFISGGSNIPITVQIMDSLPSKLTRQLTIMPVDERYGLVSHENSNVAQLFSAGFNPKRATFIPILNGTDPETTAKQYAQKVRTELASHTVIFAQLGMGADGHIAGILPHTNAVTATELAVASQGPDFLRVTTTFRTLRHITTAYLFAYGENKCSQLEQLRKSDVPLDDQPAQFFKQLSEVYVYNDQLN